MMCLLVGLVAAVPACSSSSSGAPEPRNHSSTLLGSGVINGMRYRLTVFSTPEGNLCMGLNDGASSTSTFTESGCGFAQPNDGAMASPIDTAQAGDVTAYWGPAPLGAVRVRLESSPSAAIASDGTSVAVPACSTETPSTFELPITHTLPSWTKPGGWFITQARERGCGYSDAHFFDAAGREVPEPHW